MERKWYLLDAICLDHRFRRLERLLDHPDYSYTSSPSPKALGGCSTRDYGCILMIMQGELDLEIFMLWTRDGSNTQVGDLSEVDRVRPVGSSRVTAGYGQMYGIT